MNCATNNEINLNFYGFYLRNSPLEPERLSLLADLLIVECQVRDSINRNERVKYMQSSMQKRRQNMKMELLERTDGQLST